MWCALLLDIASADSAGNGLLTPMYGVELVRLRMRTNENGNLTSLASDWSAASHRRRHKSAWRPFKMCEGMLFYTATNGDVLNAQQRVVGDSTNWEAQPALSSAPASGSMPR